MANSIQKLLFSLSTIAPILICFAIVWYLGGNGIDFAIVLGLIGLLLSSYTLLLVIVIKNKFEITVVSIDKISPNDKLVIGYIISYFVPFLSIVIKGFNPIVALLIGVLFGVFLSISNTIYPNPLLFAFGYHFYSASTIDGADDYCLISRRTTIPNKKLISCVRNVFGYLLIEERG